MGFLVAPEIGGGVDVARTSRRPCRLERRVAVEERAGTNVTGQTGRVRPERPPEGNGMAKETVCVSNPGADRRRSRTQDLHDTVDAARIDARLIAEEDDTDVEFGLLLPGIHGSDHGRGLPRTVVLVADDDHPVTLPVFDLDRLLDRSCHGSRLIPHEDDRLLSHEV